MYTKVLAENIVRYRKQKDLTQEGLAEKLGLTFQAVSKWENEQSSPDIMLLPQLANIFDISIDELFGLNKSCNQVSISSLPWEDDDTIRGIVFKGHTLLEENEVVSKFTFKFNGQPMNVTSNCNIECGEISGGATAGCDVNCGGEINGGASAGCDVNCGSEINGGATAGCDLNCGGDISGGATAGCDLNCGGDISGGAQSGGGLTANNICGAITCYGSINCNEIKPE